MPRRVALGTTVLYALFGVLWIVVSDRLLPDFGGDLEETLWLGTLKGVLFVLASATVFYVLLRVTPRVPEESPRPRAGGALLGVVFIALAGAILFVGHQVQQQLLGVMEARSHSALRSIVLIKAQRVGEWFGDQVGATAALGEMYADGAAELPGLDTDRDAHARLLARLVRTGTVLGLESVALADHAGQILLAGGRPLAPDQVTASIRNAQRGRVGFSGRLRGANGDMTGAYAYRLPVSDLGDQRAAWLVAGIDPGPRLASILQRWPLAGTRGETALASLGPEGELVFLPGFESPIHGGGVLRFPTRSPRPESGYAPRGNEGIIEGYMPDGRAVFLTMSRVSGVNWIVVGAIDREGVYQGAAEMLRNTSLVVLVAVLIAGWLILGLFRQQQMISRSMLDSVVRERDALDQHFSYLSRFANDIVLLMDDQGRILNCNDRALSAYGYTRDELVGRNALELRPPALVKAGRRQLSAARIEGGLVYETWHRRKDGTEFPVEVSVRAFPVEGETFIQSILRDITERKHVEEELRQSEARFRNTFDQTAVGFAHMAPDGRLMLVNQYFADMLGYARNELEGMTAWQISLPEDLQRETVITREMMSGQRDDCTFEKRYRCKDGRVLWAQLTVSAIRAETGQVEYFVGVIEDVGERKHLKVKLERRTKLFRALSETNRAIARVQTIDELLLEACKIAVSHVVPLAAVTRWEPGDPAVVAAAGPDAQELAEELLGLQAQSGVFPIPDDTLARRGVMVVNDIEGGRINAGTRLACLRRGIRAYASFPLGEPLAPEARFAVFSGTPDFFERDTLDLLSDMARDMSMAIEKSRERAAREQAEARFEDVAQRMSALIDAAPVPIISLDEAGRVLDVWNPAAERVFGWCREEVIGRLLPFVPDIEEARTEFAELRRRVLRGEYLGGVEVRGQRRDGSTIYLSLSASAIYGADGTHTILAVAEDITARHDAAELVRQARDELEARVAERTAEVAAQRDRAEEADRIKTAFLANMSHELRTPLNSIIGFSSLLLSGAPGIVNDEQGKQLTIVRRAGERLLALIEDILDISRLQAVDAHLSCEPTPLRDMVLRVADGLRPQAVGRGLTIETRIEPCVAMAEPRRLEQVITNLVSNAVKYTDEGGITVSCRQANDKVEIVVADSGPGISAEDQKRLFVPFAQLKRSDSGREGTGLGLAISRRLVEAMGGGISVDSEPGRGSVFTVRLDAAKVT